jgi:hypothetical protein
LPDIKHKFLCGHDERHWFVAAVPETIPVSTIVTAKQALKPEFVRQLESGRRGKRSQRHRRRTDTFVRQGEWFFLPAPEIEVNPAMIHHREPLGSRKPHYCEELYRMNGETVYVNHVYPNGLTEAERSEIFRTRPSFTGLNWQVQRRNPTVYVRGRVWHSDHATIRLTGWHRVLMNTENQSTARPFVAFLD